MPCFARRFKSSVCFLFCAQLPRPLSAEEAEALVRSLLLSDAKDSKVQIKSFLQRNRNAVLNVSTRLPGPARSESRERAVALLGE